MRVLVGCESSGIVRDAFLAAGHIAVSCDLQPTERPGPHHVGDVADLFDIPWDLFIVHPPCTDLAVSGAGFFYRKTATQPAAIEFARMCWSAPIQRIALENPVSILSSVLGKPSQIIQPWQFGHHERKSTCLWLKGLPKLQPTEIVQDAVSRVALMGPSATRKADRSRTYPGIAAAMASQWGVLA